MSRCRVRYEDLPAHLRAQVDALTRRTPVATAGAAADRGKLARGRRPSKTEAAYRAEVLGRRPDVAAVHYEGLSFRMANGHRYTPDWVVVTADGRIECHEVKGSHALHSRQRARLAFDQVKVEFPWVEWVWATRTKSGWVY